jgi:hypothetical protein
MRKFIRMIDCTPSWISLYPMFKEFILFGNQKQKDLVCFELKKLCRIADARNKK